MTDTDHVIYASGLRKAFGKTAALDGLDLGALPSEVHGLLGPNGAGKSTVIRVLLGLYRPDAGVVRLFGQDPWDDATSLHRRLAYVPGDVNLWPTLSGGEAIDLLIRLRGGDPARSDRKRLLEAFELDPSKLIRTYSKGNRQKVALVAAFSLPMELYILDEPTSGLDPLMEERFKHEVSQVAKQGAAVLLSSHILAEVEELADRVSIIRRGRTVETGSLDEMRRLTASRYTVDADLDPARFRELASVSSDLSRGEGTLTFSVEPHDTARVLGILSDARARNLVVAPASLEELFLQHYGEDITADEAADR